MIDIKLIRENADIVKENIRKKFQDEKLVIVDQIKELDIKAREAQTEGDNLKALKNKLSKDIGLLMRDKKIDEANKIKEEVANISDKIALIDKELPIMQEEIRNKMMIIPNIIDSSVPIGKDDSENVEVERFGEPVVPSYEIPHHADILDRVGGVDKESAGRVSGEGFYYLIGDIARLHEAMLACARDFMIDAGFTYAIPPFMIRANVVEGVMSFPEMEAMMYKIEGEDLYLIGTSEHSMIRFWFILLLLVAPLRAVNAQTQTISVHGQEHCGKEKVVGALVTMLQPADSSIVAYTTTDKQGFYTLKATTQLSEVLLSISGFNIKRKTTRIKAHSQTFDFHVKEENRILREIVVKSQKLWGNRDTLNYLVSAYTRGKDRSIGDVLQKLPGITIEDNGVIKYQGNPINHFYIENLDMLQGRYNLATQGIKAEDVATVQVLENHEHIRSRKDQTPSERAAINLKLKDKAKGIWNKSANLGAGHNHDQILWEAMLQTMYFGKGKQHMLRYSGDNLGRSLEIGTDHYGFSSEGNSRMVSLVEHSSSPIGNSLFGYRHSINLNNLAKLTDSITINYNFNYSHNFASGHSFSKTTYFLPNGEKQLLMEDIADRTHTHSANVQFNYEMNLQQR